MSTLQTVVEKKTSEMRLMQALREQSEKKEKGSRARTQHVGFRERRAANQKGRHRCGAKRDVSSSKDAPNHRVATLEKTLSVRRGVARETLDLAAWKEADFLIFFLFSSVYFIFVVEVLMRLFVCKVATKI